MNAASISALTGDACLPGTRGFLRIAVPSWRRMGEDPPAAPLSPALSREEIQRLFQRELSGHARRKPALTDREVHENSLARQLRTALYPAPVRFAH